MSASSPSTPDPLVQIAAARWRVALTLTCSMVVVYVGFILLVAFDKPLLARLLAPGLSVGILLGLLVIGTVWLLIAIYVIWANRHYDAVVAAVRRQR